LVLANRLQIDKKLVKLTTLAHRTEILPLGNTMRHLISLFCLAVCSLAHGQTSFDFKQKPGVYAVGLRVIRQYDNTRVYTSQPGKNDKAAGLEGNRPLQTMVWYPARQMGTPITNADYLRLSRTEDNFSLAPDELERRVKAWVAARSARMPAASVQQELSDVMWAHMDSAPAPGKFPVVIYAPGFSSSAIENADLCEYLASQGYIVIASASMGNRSRAMTQDIDGIETQATDIRFLIRFAQSLPQADLDRIGAIGFSWGGISNVVAAARDNRIRALVSLEGAFRYAPNFIDGSAGAVSNVTPGQVTVPLLYVAAGPKSIEELNTSKIDTRFSFTNGMTVSDVYTVTMRPMQHLDFASQLLRFSIPEKESEYSRDEVLTAYGWTVRYVHAFLDAYLKGSVDARAFLQKTASENGSPKHMIAIDRRVPK
jgi:dienelactone hydrolase